MKFTVIIPARSINENLKETVSHLKKVRYYDFEVIIVLDHYIEVNFGPKEDRFKVIESGEVGPAEKRNLAASFATGDVLAFLDDDAYPDPGWLRSAANIFSENESLYALGGPGLTPRDASFLEVMSGEVLCSYLTSANTTYRHMQQPRREVDDFPSVNLFVKKEAFKSVGGYDPTFWPGEDTKLCLDLLTKYNSKFLYDPEPLVYHHRRELFKPFLEQISRYGKHRGWFARKFPKNSRKAGYFIPSLFIVGLVFGVVISLLFLKILPFYLLTMFVYFTLVFSEAQKVTMEKRDFNAFKYIFLGIIGSNLVYGYNFISGFFFKPKFKLRKIDESTGNYQGG